MWGEHRDGVVHERGKLRRVWIHIERNEDEEWPRELTTIDEIYMIGEDDILIAVNDADPLQDNDIQVTIDEYLIGKTGRKKR